MYAIRSYYAVSWCWMVFGSEGRVEQGFAPDQDNGLIFQPDREEDADEIRRAFLPFTRAVNLGLDKCGFKLCPGNIMAGNPEWCLSSREWHERFSNWMAMPEPEAILKATIFFDFRPRITSYNVCYTKLLRKNGRGASAGSRACENGAA